MDTTALLALFRAEVRDEATPYLWSDVECFSYMDDAQNMFCRLQGGISDATSALTLVTVSAGDRFVSYDPRILKLRAAWRVSDSRELEILNFEDLQFGSMSRYDYGNRAPPLIDSTAGELRGLVTGMEANKFRLIHIPVEGAQIQMLVNRRPLYPLDGPQQDLEIDELHHRHLLNWMKHLAHQKQDAETYDRGRSDLFRQEFLAYCDQAKTERERREHKFRAVAYGGY